jgi:tRNA threonylcarbamoyl adenosine modification protein YeaZ
MEAPLVLALDTSTDTCSVALLAPSGSGFREVARRSARGGREHTRRLLVFADEALQEVGADRDRLAGVVVGTGPGTFTGVRIAVATARALALGLGLPVLGVPTLAALAAAAITGGGGGTGDGCGGGHMVSPAGEPTRLVVPVVDAHRGQLFGTVYLRSAASLGERGALWVQQGSVFVTLPQTVRAEVEGRAGERPTLYVGKTDSLPAGAPAANQAVQAAYLLQGQELLVHPGEVSAAERMLAWLGARDEGGTSAHLFAPGEPGSPEAVVPVYLRAPDADLHIKKMRDPWT